MVDKAGNRRQVLWQPGAGSDGSRKYENKTEHCASGAYGVGFAGERSTANFTGIEQTLLLQQWADGDCDEVRIAERKRVLRVQGRAEREACVSGCAVGGTAGGWGKVLLDDSSQGGGARRNGASTSRGEDGAAGKWETVQPVLSERNAVGRFRE